MLEDPECSHLPRTMKVSGECGVRGGDGWGRRRKDEQMNDPLASRGFCVPMVFVAPLITESSLKHVTSTNMKTSIQCLPLIWAVMLEGCKYCF